MTSKNIVFLGTHGQHNIGDELLLETFLNQLGSHHHYKVNSYDPLFTAAQLQSRFHAEVFHTVRDRSRLLRRLRTCDLVFFGGGSIIKELYASVGRNRYATLLMVLAIVTFARHIARKPIVMSNIGVGPLQTEQGRRFARYILRQVDVLSVRDCRSYETCLSLGLPSQRVQRVPDAVFANAPAQFAPLSREEVAGYPLPRPAACNGTLQPPVRVALNLNYDIENPANWTTLLKNLEDGLRALHASYPIEIHTLPMQSRFKAQHDAKVLAEFCARLPEIEVHQRLPTTHRQIAALIAGCDLLVAERLHALVIAAILGKPFVALTYDIKVCELIAGLEMTSYALDANAPFDPLALKRIAETALHKSSVIRDHLLRRSSAMRSELAHYFSRLRQQLQL
ncbi:MAG: polysaccharide pyruvyl transferase family protein [Thermoflexales bacterium]|nr:polysaccharide pyruvyl transferase family protein [Thermoflexales bacterium]